MCPADDPVPIGLGHGPHRLSDCEGPQELVQHILNGGKPSKFKDIDGVPLNDYRLHTRLSQEYPEASRVYEDTSGYVHLSRRRHRRHLGCE